MQENTQIAPLDVPICSASLVADAIAFAKQRGGDCSMLVAYAALKETGMLDAYMGIQWQPIATFDGPEKRAILVFCEDCRNTYTAYRETDIWFHYAAGLSKLTETPTHWMALPSPPNISLSSGSGE